MPAASCAACGAPTVGARQRRATTATSVALRSCAATAPPSFSQAYSSSADTLPTPTATRRSSDVLRREHFDDAAELALELGDRKGPRRASWPDRRPWPHRSAPPSSADKHDDAAFLRRGEFGEGDRRSRSHRCPAFGMPVQVWCATFGRFRQFGKPSPSSLRHDHGFNSRARAPLRRNLAVNHLLFGRFLSISADNPSRDGR